MPTRVFLCNRETWYHGVEDEIKEAKELLSRGKVHRGVWTCGSVKSIEVNDAAYFKRVGSEPLGFFAYGRIVAAEKEYQLRLLEKNYSNVSEAYQACYDEEGNVILAVAHEWYSVVDYNQPLEIKRLKQDPQFSKANFHFQGSGGSFREECITLLNECWEKHALNLSRQGFGVHLAEALYRAGQDSINQKLYVEAIDKFSQAIHVNPNLTKAYIGRGNAYQKLGKQHEALQNYTEATQIEPADNSVAYYQRGIIHAELGNKQKAIEDFTVAQKLFLDKSDLVNSKNAGEKIKILASSKTLEVSELSRIRKHIIDAPGVAKNLQEAKRKILVSIIRRQGQSLFRQNLIDVYDSRCAITNCDVEEALEAAHIIPYSDNGSNQIVNGLLLRGDLHTLFDLNLIAIEPETHTVLLHPSLRQSSYSDLHQKKLRLPSATTYKPSQEALHQRWNQCEWARNHE
ncbi:MULTISPECIES: tetratricopeptide repeat protein [Trichocoleus]|uniref:HNH endonuclease n=1 Tax=Trichocoleus desertorum GB2-A4 TaxID=2933944 RepID=A0ABV0J5U4_9CYAN|nr:tetratricopeptide repeat protein [Trichocoleus sp. FACHB-46]MBD1863278.1 HNH endonuclease [Trichocoleus sp. FACHB-46]